MKLIRLFIWLLFVISLTVWTVFVSADEFDWLEDLTLDDFGDNIALDDGVNADFTGDEFSVDEDSVDENFTGDELDFGDDELNFGDDEFNVDGSGDDANFGDDEFGLFEDTKINVVVGTTTETSVELSFDKIEDYSDYKILYAKTPLFEAPIEEVLETTTTIEEDATEGTVTIEGLEPQTNYYFVVVAMDDSGLRNDDTQSEEITVFTENMVGSASTENMIIDVDHEVNNLSADVTFTAGKDVVTVWVYVSDTEEFSEEKVEIDATSGVYSFNAADYGTKYVRLLPIDNEGIAWDPSDIEVIVFEEPAVSMGTPETGPALYLAVLFALFGSMAYIAVRRRA